jgi:hypothetical protein
LWLLQRITGKEMLHRCVVLPSAEAGQQGKRLSAMQTFARGPLNESDREDLATRPLGNEIDLEVMENCGGIFPGE